MPLTLESTGGAPGARALNRRIKSLSGLRPQGFLSVRAAGQAASAYPGEPHGMELNCNPDCNPGHWAGPPLAGPGRRRRELEREILCL